MTRADCLKLALFASSALSALPAVAGDRLPVGGSVAHGKVDISTPAAGAMAIRQSSQTAIVNWQGFSIGEGARVDIRQPSAASAMLNRVTGKTPSSIAGQLNANGQVYLVNPNGIAITPSGTVKTGAFVASTLATSDEDFIAGRRSFRGGGASAAVVNRGAIEVGKGGYAALIGGRVDNSGTISAPLGRIGLGAGERATLDLTGDGFLQIAEPSADDGDDTALISQSGRLTADGGRVEIKAATARQMAREVVNLSGVVQARSVTGHSGAIVLRGGAGGKVRVTGRLDASAPRTAMPASIDTPPARPGAITVTGRTIELAGARLDASGPAGGGTVRVGGDWQGKGTLQRAETTTVDAATTIVADALVAGDGGSVVVWSDERTAFAGRISARGGPEGGDGGAAEVSGKATLAFTGLVDLSAPRGGFGTLLLDPSNIVISDGETTGGFEPEGDGDADGDTDADGDADADGDDDTGCCVVLSIGTSETFVPGAADSVLNAAQLVAQLGLSDVIVSTASGFEADGNITVAVPLTWTSAGLLTLTTVAGDITINGAITTGDGGGLTTSTTGTTLVNAAIGIGAGGALDMQSGPLFVRAPITAGADATVSLAAPGSSIALAGMTLGAGATLAVNAVNVDVNGAINAGDNAELSFDADDAPLTTAGSFTLGDDVTLTLNGGDVTIDSTLVAGDGAIISVDSGGNPDGNPISLSGAWTVGDGADLELFADGAIDVTAPVTLGAEGSLFLSANGDMTLGDVTWGDVSDVGAFANGDLSLTGDLAGPGGDLDVYAGGTIDAQGSVDVETFTLQGGDWVQIGNPLPAFSADDFRIQDGEGGDATFLRALGGNGMPGAPYLIADAYGLQGIGSSFTVDPALPDLEDSYALANDIDASGTAGWNDFEGAEGFDPIGSLDEPFTGSLDGRLFSVTGLTIDRSFDDAVGLFASVGFGGTVSNLTLTDADIAGGPVTGGIAGVNGGVISAVRVVGGTISGSSFDDFFINVDVGGIAGRNESAIARSTSSAAVNGAGADFIELHLGGLVGVNEDTITDSMAAGAVEGTGENTVIAGGLVGMNGPEGRILRAYATGSVTATEAFDGSAGGLVGANAGIIGQTYATGAVAGPAEGASGGLVGSFFVPEIEDGGPVALALPPVDGVSSSYYDTVTTGQTTSAGGFGITTAAFQDTASFMAAAGLEDWSFTDTWSPPDPGHYPELYAIAPVIWADIGDATAVYGSTAGIRAPVTRSGGPGVYVFDRSTTAPALPLSAPGAATGGVGSYEITTVATVTSTGNVPYRVFSTPGTLAVTPAPLVITADDRSKRYGRELALGNTAFTARGLVNGDSVASVDLASLGAARGASVGDSPYAITASDAVGAGLLNPEGVSNYTIRYEPGALTVTPAPLVITANDRSKRYGRELDLGSTAFTADGLLNGDSVTRVDLASRGAARGANVGEGPFAITASNARGTGVSNYTVTYEAGALTVTPAPLVVTADDLVKMFGSTFTFDGTEFTTRGLVDGDRVLSALLRSDGSPSAAPVSREPYRIDISDALGTGLSFDGVANYDISYVPGEMLVVPFDPSMLPTYNAGLRLVYYTQLPNPDDVIEIADTEDFGTGGGGGPLLAPVRATGLTLARQNAQDALTFVESISDRLERRVAECDPVRPDPDAYLNCVSDALSRYANELDGRILDLPEPLRRVSAVIRDSAREIEGVRADAARRLALATTDAEREAIARDAAARAAAAMQTAVDEIRSAIQLIRAEDDPQLASLETRQGEAITAALQNVGDELTRAVGL